MFGSLLKQKLEINEKLRKLHNKYIALRQQSIIENNEADDSKRNTSQLLKKKQNTLKTIKQEYTDILVVYNKLTELLKESKESALDLEEHIDLIADRLNIQFPEELKRVPKKSVIPVPEIQLIDENQFDDNNIQLITEDQFSDKENSNSDITPQDEYFSPQIQIRKSFATEDKLYTPAIKSQTKRRNP